MNIEGKSVQTAFAAAISAVTCYLGIVAVPIVVLLLAMIIDYVTGMISAWHKAELSSKKGVFGIVKKVSYLGLVCVGMGVDWLIYSGLHSVGVDLGYTIFFGLLVTIWLVINELISILENLGSIGVPLPKFLLTIIKKLKTTTESKVESEDEKEDEKRN